MNKELELRECPICGYESYSTQGIHNHIQQKARFEVWQKAIGSKIRTLHFDYYMENTKPKTPWIEPRLERSWK